MTNSYATTKKQPKSIRLTGSLIVEINGTKVEVSDSFVLQTDLTYSGMSVPQQDTVLKAYLTALSSGAEIRFHTNLTAQEIKAKQKAEPTALDLMLQDLNKADPEQLAEAATREEQDKSKSIQGSLDILGATSVQKDLAETV